MKRGWGRQFIFCMAAGILMMIADTTIVYGTQQEEIETVKEEQERLQEEQRAHNEEIARQNREAVEVAVAKKVAEQYAAMGLVPPQEEAWSMAGNAMQGIEGDVQQAAGKNETQDMGIQALVEEKEEKTPEKLWADLSSGNGKFAALYENVEEEQERGEIPEDTLSALLDSLTICGQPVTDVTLEKIKELFPANNFIYASAPKSHEPGPDMRGTVRYGDSPGFFSFNYDWSWDREIILSVKYENVNQEGNFTRIVFDAPGRKRYQHPDWSRIPCGYNVLFQYNLGYEGLSSYLIDNKCLYVRGFMELAGVEIELLDEEREVKEGILCRSFATEYGDVTAFYYQNPDTERQYFALNFEDNDTYDYILAEGESGGMLRIEIKLKEE